MDFESLAKTLIAGRSVSQRFERHLIECLHEAYGVKRSSLRPDFRCFVNTQSNTYQKELNNICGDLQWSPVRPRDGKTAMRKNPDVGYPDYSKIDVLVDSGAFTDVKTGSRVAPEIALCRQLQFLKSLPEFPAMSRIVSYDLLIDEKNVEGVRKKERWSVEEGETAVKETVAAAKYLHSQRVQLKNIKLVQSCQGVDANQYLGCVEKVLEYCQPEDCLGLGGWCILGMKKQWLPTFYETIDRVLPVIAEAGIKQVHIFGCTWYKPIKSYNPPLPVLLYECDRHGIDVSTDGRSPISNALWKDTKKSGATFPYWRHNLAWVKAELAVLRDSPFYAALKTKQTFVLSA